MTRLGVALLAAAVACLLWAVALTARAHQAPSGWEYDPECCFAIDCAPIAPVRASPGGLRTLFAIARIFML